MIKLKFNKGDLFCSEELAKIYLTGELESEVETYADRILERVFESLPESEEYINAWGQLKGLSRLAILSAHGSSNGKWMYSDVKGEHEVNRWIGRVDGKYSGLIIDVCNPGTHVPISKKSIVMFPDHDVSTLAMACNTKTKPASYELYVPKIGEINPMVIEYELRQLKDLNNKEGGK